LPDPFGPKEYFAPKSPPPPLMSPEDHDLELDPSSSDPVVLDALGAANASYAPYSGGFAGIALQTASSAVYVGRYAENAAFNPSMSPLESALTMWALGGTGAAITRVVLVEVPSPATQVPVTEDLLAAISNSQIQLEVHSAKVTPPSP
jgi:cytidine deaminase